MAQKVITVAAYSERNAPSIQELDFPKVTQALNEGYTVKKIKQVELPQGNESNRFVLTFLLEKKD